MVGIPDFARNASKTVEEVERMGKQALVTRHGHPAAALVPLDAGEFEDFILTTAPEFVRGRQQADAELLTGVTRSLTSLIAEFALEVHPPAPE